MQARSIKFTIEKRIRAPKEINEQKTIFAVFAPERLTIYPGQTIFIHTKFAVTYTYNISYYAKPKKRRAQTYWTK